MCLFAQEMNKMIVKETAMIRNRMFYSLPLYFFIDLILPFFFPLVNLWEAKGHTDMREMNILLRPGLTITFFWYIMRIAKENKDETFEPGNRKKKQEWMP
jgi:hypothetical protein